MVNYSRPSITSKISLHIMSTCDNIISVHLVVSKPFFLFLQMFMLGNATGQTRYIATKANNKRHTG